MIHPLACANEPPYHRKYRHTNRQLWYPVEIDPSATVEALCVVCQGVERPTVLGPGVWLMSQVHIGHDTQIGENTIICPMTSIAGHVTVGSNVRIDQGVTIRPFITIGDGARIGMGAVVVKDVPPGETWVGNPAKMLYPSGRDATVPIT